MILLPVETVHVTMLPCRDSRQGSIITRTVSAGRISAKKHNHANNLGRKPFFADSNLGRKQEIAGSLDGSQILRTVSAGHIFTFHLPLIQEGQLSVAGESMCTKYWLTA